MKLYKTFLAAAAVVGADAHGYLSKPVARNTLGKQSLGLCSWGGTGARCSGDYMSLGGVSGSDATGCAPAGGKLGVTGNGGLSFATTQYKTAYAKGVVMDVEIDITAYHGGKFEFRLQNVGAANDPSTDAWSAPLTVNSFSPACSGCTIEPCAPTTTAAGTCAQIPLAKPATHTGTYSVQVQLPADVECDHCVLQWHWTSSNSCGNGLACSQSEQFWNCADLKIGGGDSGSIDVPAAPSTPAATPATPAATPATPAATPTTPATPPATSSCCRSLQAHIADSWCQSSCASMIASYPLICAMADCSSDSGSDDAPATQPAPTPEPEPEPTPTTMPTAAPAADPTTGTGTGQHCSAEAAAVADWQPCYKKATGAACCANAAFTCYQKNDNYGQCRKTGNVPASWGAVIAFPPANDDATAAPSAPISTAPTSAPSNAATPATPATPAASSCTAFKSACQSKCLARSGGVATNQCWGSPLLYVECKCSDGEVEAVTGFVCTHPSCPTTGTGTIAPTTPITPAAPTSPATPASPAVPAVPAVPTAPSTPTAVGSALESALGASEASFKADVLLYETPTGAWQPSSVYKFADLRVAITQMYTKGIGSRKLLLGDSVEEALVNIAAFLAQSMKETIKYDACDENSWDLVAGKYPASNACGQLGQSYQDYTCPAGEEHMQCEVDPDMEITATTNANWYGAPGPMKCGPKSKMPQPGYWDYSAQCNKPWASPPQSCADYAGQKAGGWVTGVSTPNSNDRTDVEGCCYWGRGVIQTTGICNFGKLNYWLGKRAAREGRDAAYPDIDFCREPDAICASTAHPELKWIAGLFYWAESVQTYSKGGWDYQSELKAFVSGGMQRPGTDAGFIHAVSGIVNRGCHSPPCGTGALDGGAERARNFEKVLKAMGLVTSRRLNGRPNTKTLRGASA